ncbi:MAG TPA: CsgG/HfaB family protein [Verrucomicrobiae bacterium]|nr:CsgG/HfaB family protein [Verrucomicrobiae bacterium]
MKTRFLSVLLLLLALAPVAKVQADEPETVPIAVLNVAGPRRTLANNISALLTVNLSAEKGFVLVDRNQLDKVLAEQALGRSGTISPETAARIGKLTGAKILITGRAFNGSDRGQLILIASVIGAETGRVFSHTIQGAQSNLVGVVAELSSKLIGTIREQSSNLLGITNSRGTPKWQQIARGLKRDHLPKVAVRIEESFPGNRKSEIASTELGRILQQTGFTVLDSTGRDEVDLIISGDALVDDATRRADLFSCRATVQIKVQDRKTGRLLLLDLEHGAGADPAKETATAEALRNAVDELASRLLPALVSAENEK